jgi:hypothetical protein
MFQSLIFPMKNAKKNDRSPIFRTQTLGMGNFRKPIKTQQQNKLNPNNLGGFKNCQVTQPVG